MNEKLLKKLEDAQQWDTLILFEHHTIAERPDLLAYMCERAAKKRDDEGAIRLFECLLLAIEDVRADTLRKEDPPREKMTERQRQCEEVTKVEQASYAVALWRLTPEHRVGRWHDRETYESGNTKEPTLLAYKLRLIATIVGRWRETNSEEEAATLFARLEEILRRKDPGAEDLLANAMRDAKEHHAHRQRTMRGILKLLEGNGAIDPPGKSAAFTLWNAMMRTFETREVQALGAILQYLPLSSLGPSWSRDTDTGPMIQAVAEAAKISLKMHEAMRELRASLKLKRDVISEFRPAYRREHRRVDLSIGIRPGFTTKEHAENDFHDIFTELRDQMRDWVASKKGEENDVAVINLRVYWPVERGEPKFVRTIEIR